MNILTPISTFGRVTADLELKTSQNGNNTPYVSFSLAVDKGFGAKNMPFFCNASFMTKRQSEW